MDNEKYGIELELITNKFKQKMQEVKSAFGSLTDKKVNLNANTSQIEYLKRQIGELTADLQLNSKTKFWNDTETLKAQSQLEKLTNQYNKLIAKQNEVQESSMKSSANIRKGIDKMTSKIKRFGLALLSVRSIFSLVSRASSAYLAQDTELANKLQSAWIGLGAILAPIINFITTLILKLVSVINGFIKALTGVDLIAKASSKSMKGAAGSANALRKALAGFDELTNLDSDTSGGGGIGGLLDPFETIDEDWANMMEKIYKTTDKFKTNFIKKLKDSIEDGKKVLRNAGFSEDFIYMYDIAASGSIRVLEGFIDSFKGILLILDGVLTADKDKIIRGFKELISGIWNMILGLGETVLGFVSMILVGIRDGVVAAWNWIFNNVIMPIEKWHDEKIRQPLKKMFSDLWNSIKNGASSAWNWIIGQLNGTKENFKNFINTIGGWFSKLWQRILEGFDVVKSYLGTGSLTGMISRFGFNSYDVGTNYVPRDQLAFIHKGEAVVPKKYNTGSYQPNNNNETNELLAQVIEAINGIEINPYTTVRDVGKASLNYINGKSRQLGQSVVY